MVLRKSLPIWVLAAGFLTSPVMGQDHRVQLAGYAGAVAPIADLGQVYYPLAAGGVGYRHFTKGVSFGANATYWLDNNLGLRADGNYAGSKVVEPVGVPGGCAPACQTSETKWNKIFISGDLVLRAPTASGITPFGYFGAGVAKMKESGTGRTATRPTGRVGAGLNFSPSNSGVGFFGELGLMVYDFDQTKFTFYDKVQTDLALKAGISFGL